MDIHLSQSDGVPIYRQIINQIKQLIDSGRIAEDQELPAIRVLAQVLLINPNTVARAYRELEADGWLYKKQGAGTYVSDRSSPLSLKERRRRIRDRINTLLTDAHQMDVSVDLVIAMIRQADVRNQSADSEINREAG